MSEATDKPDKPKVTHLLTCEGCGSVWTFEIPAGTISSMKLICNCGTTTEYERVGWRRGRMTKDNRLGLGILILNCTLMILFKWRESPDIFLRIVTILGAFYGYYLLTKGDGGKAE